MFLLLGAVAVHHLPQVAAQLGLSATFIAKKLRGWGPPFSGRTRSRARRCWRPRRGSSGGRRPVESGGFGGGVLLLDPSDRQVGCRSCFCSCFCFCSCSCSCSCFVLDSVVSSSDAGFSSFFQRKKLRADSGPRLPPPSSPRPRRLRVSAPDLGGDARTLRGVGPARGRDRRQGPRPLARGRRPAAPHVRRARVRAGGRPGRRRVRPRRNSGRRRRGIGCAHSQARGEALGAARAAPGRDGARDCGALVVARREVEKKRNSFNFFRKKNFKK